MSKGVLLVLRLATTGPGRKGLFAACVLVVGGTGLRFGDVAVGLACGVLGFVSGPTRVLVVLVGFVEVETAALPASEGKAEAR